MAAGNRDVSPQNILGKQMLAGGLAGMLADGVMYPMMTVKSRLMVCTLQVLTQIQISCP
jgi:hypothetical protein